MLEMVATLLVANDIVGNYDEALMFMGDHILGYDYRDNALIDLCTGFVVHLDQDRLDHNMYLLKGGE